MNSGGRLTGDWCSLLAITFDLRLRLKNNPLTLFHRSARPAVSGLWILGGFCGGADACRISEEKLLLVIGQILDNLHDIAAFFLTHSIHLLVRPSSPWYNERGKEVI